MKFENLILLALLGGGALWAYQRSEDRRSDTARALAEADAAAARSRTQEAKAKYSMWGTAQSLISLFK